MPPTHQDGQEEPWIPWWQTHFGAAEIEMVARSVGNRHISHGPVTERLEQQIAATLEIPYVVVTTSGSAALFLALKALGIGNGDEVILPDRTWIATAHAVLLAGARPVLVDTTPSIPNIDPERIERRISGNTRAIMPVHLNGRAADMEAIGAIADRHGLFVVEDACQAMLSRNRRGEPLGTLSDIGCFSMGVTKLFSTGQGGFAVTRSRRLWEAMRLVRNHGVVDNFTDRWNLPGFNFKFTDIQASFGLVQLERASERIRHLRRVYRRYEALLAPLSPHLRLLPVDLSAGEVPLYVEVLTEDRDALLRHLANHRIQARPVPPCLHASPYLSGDDSFEHASFFADHTVYLPCGPGIPLDAVDTVAAALHAYADFRRENKHELAFSGPINT
ncbi:MAG: DegT/DnrJ/EryC1/StrS family aminotransferase [Zetaproteobacteria bacterium]|nr:MAG: DegT/DnrJ/EryC1/StrS family aminotransferase [Zetaproteobacteria bacterium]